METSPNLNSQPGTNGPEEMQPEEKTPVLLSKPARKRQKQTPDSESEREVVTVVEDLDNAEAILSPADAKLAIRMNRHIMSVLGLDKRSRSFKV